MGLFMPGWMSEKEARAVQAVEKLKDQSEIARAAKESPHIQARIAAINKLTDQDALEHMAITDKDNEISSAAVKRLTDQTKLLLVGKGSKNLDARFLAAEMLKQTAHIQEVYASIAGDDSLQWMLRIITAEKLTDNAAAQKAYAGALLNYPDSRSFTNANLVEKTLNRIADQSAIADVVLNAKSIHVCRAAAKKLTDQAMLAKVAAESEEYNVLAEVKDRLTDQSALAYVAQNAKDRSVREKAAGRLKDERLLADLAKNDNDCEVRQAAVERLTDQAVMADLAKNSKDGNVRWLAVAKLTDQAVLADVLKNEWDESICEKAIQKITDQALLADIVKNGRGAAARLAVEKISDQAVLSYYAFQNDRSIRGRLIAADKLADKALAQEVYADIVKGAYQHTRGLEIGWDEIAVFKMRGDAISRITDEGVLNEIINGGEIYAREYYCKMDTYDTKIIDLREIASERLRELKRRYI